MEVLGNFGTCSQTEVRMKKKKTSPHNALNMRRLAPLEFKGEKQSYVCNFYNQPCQGLIILLAIFATKIEGMPSKSGNACT